MESIDKCLLTGMLLFIFCMVAFLCDEVINNPLASEDALQKCQERGYTTYDSFTRQPFSTTALGVKCEHPIINYDIDGQIIPAIIVK